jgi:hypothetical protein
MTNNLPPIKIFLVNNTDLVCCQDELSVFREKYGRRFELVDTIKDSRNLEDVLPRLAKLYNANDIIIDCHVEKRWGWRYMSQEQRDHFVQAIKAYRTGRPWSQEVKDKISASRKGKGNFEGKKHTPTTKMMMAMAKVGKPGACKGRVYCHDPITGKHKRLIPGSELPEGFVWGCAPGRADHLPKDGSQFKRKKRIKD